jgi:hypothetical protein
MNNFLSCTNILRRNSIYAFPIKAFDLFVDILCMIHVAISMIGQVKKRDQQIVLCSGRDVQGRLFMQEIITTIALFIPISKP